MHSIIQRAIERHCGIESYRAVKAIGLRIDKLGGMIPRAKGVLEEALPPLEPRPAMAAAGGRSC